MSTYSGRRLERKGRPLSQTDLPLLAAYAVSIVLAVAGALDLLGLRVLQSWPAGLLVASNALVILAAFRLVLALAPSDDWDQIVLDVGIAALGLVLLTMLALGTLGVLSLGAVTFALGVESLGIAHFTRRAAAPSPRGPVVGPAWLWGLFGGLILFEVAQVLYANLLLPPSGDAIGYHLPLAVEWIQTHRFTMPVPAAGSPNPPYYPLNSSIWMAWLMLPLPGDALVRLVQAPFLPLLFLAAARLSRSLGTGRAASWVVAAVVVSLPDVVRSIAVAGNDLILASLLFVATASLVELWKRPSFPRLVLGLLALGLACGTKEAALPYVAPLGLAYLVAIARGWWQRWPRVAALYGLAAGVVLLTGGYSYARNLVVMANPFYPATYRLAGRVIFPGLYATTTEWKEGHPLYAFDWLGLLLDSRTDFGYAVPLLVVAGGVLAGAFALRGRKLGPLALLAWAVAGFGIFWYVLPVHEDRFLYATVGWAVVVGAWGWLALVERRPSLLVPPAALLVAVSAASVPKYSDVLTSAPYWLAAAAVVAAVWLGAAVWRRLDAALARGLLGVGAAVGVVLLLALIPAYAGIYDSRRFEQWPRVVTSDEQPRAWQWIATATRHSPAVLDVAGTNNVYPLYGPDLRNRVVRVTPDGAVAGYDWGRPTRPSEDPNAEQWAATLDRENVRYLYVVPDIVAGGWPIEAQWAAQEPDRFRLVVDGSEVRIWERVG